MEITKRFVNVVMISKDYLEIVLIKRKKPPYVGSYNLIGGKIETGELPKEAATREVWEETGGRLKDPQLLAEMRYGTGESVTIFYEFVDKYEIVPEKGQEVSWMPIAFALDFDNHQLSGLGDIAYFTRFALVYGAGQKTKFVTE